jgi:hypothetical protein
MHEESRKNTQAERAQKSRERLRAAGGTEILLKLPVELVQLLDETKRHRGLRSRSEVVIQFFEQGRADAQQTT